MFICCKAAKTISRPTKSLIFWSRMAFVFSSSNFARSPLRKARAARRNGNQLRFSQVGQSESASSNALFANAKSALRRLNRLIHQTFESNLGCYGRRYINNRELEYSQREPGLKDDRIGKNRPSKNYMKCHYRRSFGNQC